MYGYQIGPKDIFYVLLLSLALTALVSLLFYNSVFGVVWLLPFGVLVYGLYLSYLQKRRYERIKKEFREVLLSVANGLSAGISVENAFVDAERNIWILFGKEGVLQKELFRLNQKVQMGTAIEKQFYRLAKTIDMEEMNTFSELFLYAKRTGGDYTKNLRNLALRIDEKIGMKEEMEAQMAEKMLELKIMAAVPIVILLYFRITAYDFLKPIYESAGGKWIMTGCVVLYLCSVLLGVYIVRHTLEV